MSQGCGDAGCVPNSFPGYQSTDSNEVRDKFARAWGAPMPDEQGLVVTDMIRAIEAGGITAMYVVGENPLLSEPDLHHAEESFQKLEFLVAQDLFMNETAAVADVFLPASSFAEKDGTFTNSERRVQRDKGGHLSGRQVASRLADNLRNCETHPGKAWPRIQRVRLHRPIPDLR